MFERIRQLHRMFIAHSAVSSFLIMDVTSYERGWVRVSAESLFEAMKSFNMVENRGYMLIQDSWEA